MNRWIFYFYSIFYVRKSFSLANHDEVTPKLKFTLSFIYVYINIIEYNK